LFNFHPAKIFLGDTGSLLVGTLLGMFAIRGSLKSGMTVALVIPVLAMGVPIVDTLLAIVRRWIRRLPWNSPDHGHLHHRLIAFGLSTRQASMFLYSLTLLLCASALASVALQSDLLAALLGALGLLGLGVVLTARREERMIMLTDFRQRLSIRRIEQRVARVAWEGIQRLANCTTVERLAVTTEETAGKLQCDHFRLRYTRAGLVVLERRGRPLGIAEDRNDADAARRRVHLRFSLSEWPGEELLMEFQQNDNEAMPLSVGGQFLARFSKELLERVRQLCAETAPDQGGASTVGRATLASA
jgi:UDP-GlcNAc:undecaprenyl-phosphate GlcNAc-1-phosphate transferase